MRKQWGDWNLDSEKLILYIQKIQGERYLIPLVKCSSSAEILDWIIRFRQKPWASSQDLCDLIGLDGTRKCIHKL